MEKYTRHREFQNEGGKFHCPEDETRANILVVFVLLKSKVQKRIKGNKNWEG